MKPADLAHRALDEMLRSGRLPAQSRLPSERELAQQLAVSRTALRAGLQRLEAEGRIWRHVGQGTFVGQRPVLPPKRLSFITANTGPVEVLEARLAIEPQIARLAALRASELQINEMRSLVQKGRAAAEPATWELWDGQLHRALCHSTGNRLHLSIFDSFNVMRRQKTWRKLRRKALTVERMQHYAVQHLNIVEAIGGRDAALAEAIMRGHVEEVAHNLLATSASSFPA